MGYGNENIALINSLGGKTGACISTNEAILCAEIERMRSAWNEQKTDIYQQWSESKSLADSRLETIKAMSGYLDDVAEALGVAKPSTPVEGIGACWKVMAVIQRRNKALESLLNVADYEERKRIIDAALAESV